MAALAAALLAIAAPGAHAATASSSPPSIIIGGDDGGIAQQNQVTLRVPLAGSKYEVTEQVLPVTAGSGCTATGDPSAVDCDSFQIQNAGVFLHDGNDTFANNTNLPAIVDGGDGNDTLGGGAGNDQLAGNLGNDFMYGSDGNDFITDEGLFGAGGTDQLYGQDGNDRLDGGAIADTGAGADLLDGGDHSDTILYAKRTKPLTITEDGDANDGQAGEHDNVTNVETMVLGSAGDHVVADGSADTLRGQGGGDSLNGAAGNDQLFGGNGNDVLNGSTGADVLSGGANRDTATYASRTARVVVTIGLGANDGAVGEKDSVLEDVETVIGGAGNDSLTGEDGANELIGGNGADQLAGLGGDDDLNGGKGADTLQGGSGDETLAGGPNADQISGSSGDDVIAARDAAKDKIDCGTGDDHVTVDVIDVVASNCEHVSLPGRAR